MWARTAILRYPYFECLDVKWQSIWKQDQNWDYRWPLWYFRKYKYVKLIFVQKGFIAYSKPLILPPSILICLHLITGNNHATGNTKDSGHNKHLSHSNMAAHQSVGVPRHCTCTWLFENHMTESLSTASQQLCLSTTWWHLYNIVVSLVPLGSISVRVLHDWIYVWIPHGSIS